MEITIKHLREQNEYLTNLLDDRQLDNYVCWLDKKEKQWERQQSKPTKTA